MKLKAIFNIIYIVILVILIVFAGLLFLSKKDNRLGIRTFAVLSGSMEPNIHVGSLIISQKQNSYQTRDIVTANITQKGERPTFLTHRIIKVSDKDGHKVYQTQGDANKNPDEQLLTDKQIVGKVVLYVPYLGRLISFIQTQTGLLILVIVPSTIVIYSELMNIKNRVVFLMKNKKKKQAQNLNKDKVIIKSNSDQKSISTKKYTKSKNNTKEVVASESKSKIVKKSTKIKKVIENKKDEK